MTALPPGFVIDQPATPQIPSGFVLDAQPEPEGQSYDDMLGKARVETYSDPGTALTAYAANTAQALPFVGSFTDEAASGVGAAFGAGEGETFKERYENLQQRQQALRQAGEENHPGATAVGQAGVIVGSLAVPTGAAVSGADKLSKAEKLVRVAKAVGVGGAAGATYGAGVTDSSLPDEQAAAERGTNAKMLGALGAAAPIVASGAEKAARFLGEKASPVIRELAAEAERLGIPLTADQISQNPHLKRLGLALKNLPFTGRAATEDAQRKAYNTAIAGKLGENADEITAGLVGGARRRAGKVLEDINARSSVVLTDDALTKLGEIESLAKRRLVQGEDKIITNIIDEVLQKSKNGALAGETYQAFRTDLNQMVKTGDFKGKLAGDIKRVLDDAMNAGLTGQDAAANVVARRQYGNAKSLQKLAAKAGADSGDISPALVFNRVVADDPDMVRDLAPLARVGKQFLRSPADSSTATNQLWRDILTKGAPYALGAGAAYGGVTDPAETAKALALYTVLGRGSNAALKSKSLRQFLLEGSPKAAATSNAVARFLRSPASVTAVQSARH